MPFRCVFVSFIIPSRWHLDGNPSVDLIMTTIIRFSIKQDYFVLTYYECILAMFDTSLHLLNMRPKILLEIKKRINKTLGTYKDINKIYVHKVRRTSNNIIIWRHGGLITLSKLISFIYDWWCWTINLLPLVTCSFIFG